MGPQWEREHCLALDAAKQATASPMKGSQQNVEIGRESAEFHAVTDYFLSTLNRGDEIYSLTRLQNANVFQRFAANETDEELTVMFHGCRSHTNEESIRMNGFQVSHCRSGGHNFGTWFAYNAKYSDAGYVFMDEEGFHHIFVCVVSRRYVVKDDHVMRVVAQDCAYPLWLLRYRRATRT